MKCFDSLAALLTFHSAALIVAGAKLMTNPNVVSRGFGAFCFAFGYLLLGVTASGNDLGSINYRSRRYMIGIGAALSVIAGTFLLYYHVQDKINKALPEMLKHQEFRDNILKSIPVISHVLIYAGFAGIILSMALNDDNSVHYVKALMGLVAFAVIYYTKQKMLNGMLKGSSNKQQIAHILSWGLLILAISYNC
jgi:membrane associated rhomboid family serine protease